MRKRCVLLINVCMFMHSRRALIIVVAKLKRKNSVALTSIGVRVHKHTVVAAVGA
jgi:hypothetical protein